MTSKKPKFANKKATMGLEKSQEIMKKTRILRAGDRRPRCGEAAGEIGGGDGGGGGGPEGSGDARGWVAGPERKYGSGVSTQRKSQKFKNVMIEKISHHVQFQFILRMLFVEIFIKSRNVWGQLSHLSRTPRFRMWR